MSMKPIFVATHPRACSTAFERAFMTRHDILTCIHEPFGDAFYFGPERLSKRYENKEQERLDSGFHTSTYKTVLETIEKEAAEGKRIFIKDMAHYLLPPNGLSASVVPSLHPPKKGVGTDELAHDDGSLTNNHVQNGPVTNGHTNGYSNGLADAEDMRAYPNGGDQERNPTVLPKSMLEKFQFTFLIRDPHFSVPSYYRCSVPPLDKVTGFHDFMPSEAGYVELRHLLNYLAEENLIGPGIVGRDSTEGAHETNGAANASRENGTGQGNHETPICVIDADDLLDDPAGVIEAFCRIVDIPFDPAMLRWDTEADHEHASCAFAKWKGFHDDAIASREFRPRKHKSSSSSAGGRKRKSEAEFDAEWRAQFGDQGAKTIREVVDKNMPHYEYLRGFALKV